MLVATVASLIMAIWIAHRWQHGGNRPITLVLARLLRRAGRWLWAAGEGLEHGFLHSRRVRNQIRLDLEAQP